MKERKIIEWILGREARKTETHKIGQIVRTENYRTGFREGETKF